MEITVRYSFALAKLDHDMLAEHVTGLGQRRAGDGGGALAAHVHQPVGLKALQGLADEGAGDAEGQPDLVFRQTGA